MQGGICQSKFQQTILTSGIRRPTSAISQVGTSISEVGSQKSEVGKQGKSPQANSPKSGNRLKTTAC